VWYKNYNFFHMLTNMFKLCAISCGKFLFKKNQSFKMYIFYFSICIITYIFLAQIYSNSP
jgi:hypothetical protein